MTAPAIPSTGLQDPRTAASRFDPGNVSHWINVLTNASKVPSTAPDYASARQWAQTAVANIRHLNRTASAGDWATASAPTGKAQSPVRATLGALVHGASLGLGEPISGLAAAVSGGSFREGAQSYREGMDDIEEQHPALSTAGEVIGGLVPGFIAPGLAAGNVEAQGAMTAGGKIPFRQLLKAALSNPRALAKGAGVAAAMGGAQGFSQGGEDPGDFGTRLKAGLTNAAVVAPLGAIGTGVARGVKLSNAEQDLQAAARLARLSRSVARGHGGAPVPPVEALPQLPEIPADLAHRADVRSAVADYLGGKISHTDLETALEYAGRSEAVGPTGAAAVPGAPGVDLTPQIPQAQPDPLNTPTFLRRRASVVPVPRGLGPAEGVPIPPETPPPAATAETMARVQRGATQGQLAARAAQLATPTAPSTPGSPDLTVPMKQLQILLNLSPAEFKNAGTLIDPAVFRQVRALRALRAKP